ncbi:hypothetical protein E8A74_24045 [Polyangium fumosum]|uniref:Uncharacterized protein n=1 Tax=Polyangium fumosum TaxID=889272 RepID=A0A4U1JAM5_9BACT|nr:hypothetical protein E8A74_24045 [Polyangium fumosum]
MGKAGAASAFAGAGAGASAGAGAGAADSVARASTGSGAGAGFTRDAIHVKGRAPSFARSTSKSRPVLMRSASRSVNATSPSGRRPTARARIIATTDPSTTKRPARSARTESPNACFKRRPT